MMTFFLHSFALLLLMSPKGLHGISCSTKFKGKIYNKCINLESQEASIAWSMYPKNDNMVMDIVFSGKMVSSSGWIGWGINPVAASSMVGTRALIAFTDPSSGSPTLLPFLLDEEVKSMHKPLTSHAIDLHVVTSSVEFASGSHATIFATIRLAKNHTMLNHVWNRGTYVRGYSPGIHGLSGDDLRATQSIEMVSGYHASNKENRGIDVQKLKTAHGVLNSISWGFMLVLGVMSCRYLKQFKSMDPAWFYIHICLQIVGYTLGAVGWVTGLKLGELSTGVVHEFHRALGMTIFALGSVQIFAVLCRPKKTHKLRRYWKSYHHFVGYACIIISVVNVYQGIGLLQLPQDSYLKLVYSLVIATIIGVCAVLEVNSWILFFKSKDEDADGHSNDHSINKMSLFRTF